MLWLVHDLRGPSHRIAAMADALGDGLAADPADHLRRIRAETEELTRMVQDLLDLGESC